MSVYSSLLWWYIFGVLFSFRPCPSEWGFRERGMVWVPCTKCWQLWRSGVLSTIHLQSWRLDAWKEQGKAIERSERNAGDRKKKFNEQTFIVFTIGWTLIRVHIESLRTILKRRGPWNLGLFLLVPYSTVFESTQLEPKYGSTESWSINITLCSGLWIGITEGWTLTSVKGSQ